MTRSIPQLQPGLFDELVVDNFAGGGGASLGMEWALGRAVDIAINHDREAVAMHTANHPYTSHYCEDVWTVDPVEVCKGRPVGLAWFSPDCKHFSKAKGGKPVSRRIRGLAWVVIRWAQKVRPRVIMLENVEEFQDWGPLRPVCDRRGREKKGKDGKPILKPCGVSKGETFYRWKARLEKLGYVVDWKKLRACDYGAPTIRKRLFLVARCDGLPIVWPEPTHGEGLLPYRTAADCIDWSIPAPSIFERKRPLAENTLKRIAKGLQKFVFEAADPFFITYYGPKSDSEFRGFGLGNLVPTQTTENRFGLVSPTLLNLTHGGRLENIQQPFKTVTAANRGEKALVAPFLTECANGASARNMPADEPARTITAWPKGGSFALVAPHVQRQFGESVGNSIEAPLGTVTAGGLGKSALVAAFMAQHNGGFYDGSGRAVDAPLSTITHSGSQQGLVAANLVRNFGSSSGWSVKRPTGTLTSKDKDSLVTSHLIKLRGTCRHGQSVGDPMPTVTAGGLHIGEVRAFLIKYYGCGDGQSCKEPMHTVTSKDRLGLVTVAGEEYQLVDIGMRMLVPRELYRAQGFPDEYIIDSVVDGKPLTKTAQVRMCGNSVSPYPAAALVRANVQIRSAAEAAV